LGRTEVSGPGTAWGAAYSADEGLLGDTRKGGATAREKVK